MQDDELKPIAPPPELIEDDKPVDHPVNETTKISGEIATERAEEKADRRGVPTYVVFDTETTGIFLFRDKATGEPVPADDPRQPRMASVAFILCDEAGCEINREKRYIKPDGWSMPQGFDDDGKPRAGQVNGLTDEFLEANGVPVAKVLDMWEGFISQGLIAIAHNAMFDAKMMRAELRRAGRHDLFEETKQTCTMRSCKPYADQGMPIKRGQYVKLEAACEFFGIVLENAHDAMADAEACRAILERLLQDGNLLEPKVHYAKVKANG
jgi:DNA polymerase-3 subunit epsilon